jgi:nucleotide-binding universal stress UspA family protein
MGGIAMSSAQQRVTAGVDGSPTAQVAVDWAIEEARARRLPLRLVYAVTWPVSATAFRDRIATNERDALVTAGEAVLHDRRDYARALVPGLAVTTHLVDGYPAAELIAESRTAELLVIGQRGLGGFAGLVRGSVSLHVTAHAHCPVLVVPPGTSARGAVTGRVVVGLDGSASALRALRFGAEEGALRGVPVTALHTLQSLDPRPPIEELLDECRKNFPELRIEARVERGSPAGALLDAATTGDLLVVGSHGLGAVRGLLLGSTSQAVLHHAPCPVAVVRAGIHNPGRL